MVAVEPIATFDGGPGGPLRTCSTEETGLLGSYAQTIGEKENALIRGRQLDVDNLLCCREVFKCGRGM